MQNVHQKVQELEREHSGCSEALKRQASELQFGAEREARLRKELEVRTSPSNEVGILIATFRSAPGVCFIAEELWIEKATWTRPFGVKEDKAMPATGLKERKNVFKSISSVIQVRLKEAFLVCTASG